jgi:hypothetical protein
MPSNRASRTFSRCPTSSLKMTRTLDSRVGMRTSHPDRESFPPSLAWMLEFSPDSYLGANATVSLWFRASADRIDIVSGNRFTLTTPIDCQ